MYPYEDPTPWGAIIGLSLLGLVIWGLVMFAAVYGALVLHDSRPERIAKRDAKYAPKPKPDDPQTPPTGQA